MQLKTYEAYNMKEAIKAIKSELGPDAVILSSKEKKMPGTDQLGVEVTAAAAYTATNSQSVVSPKDTGLEVSSTLKKHLNTIEKKIDTLAAKTLSKSFLQGVESNISNLNLLFSHYIKTNNSIFEQDLHPDIVNVIKQLQLMEVDNSYIRKLVDHLTTLPDPKKNALNHDYYKTHAMRYFMRRIKISPPIEHNFSGVNIQCFVGQSASGKTSTLCKIATRISKQTNKKILIASIDNSKLGGNEYLRIYSKLIDIEYASFKSIDDLIKRANSLSQDCLILLDTPPPNKCDQNLIEALIDLKSEEFLVDFHLLLPISDKQINQDKSIGIFSSLGIRSIIFTKLDEGWTYGEMFNMSQKWSLPLSYFCLGHQVPEDLEEATRERVLSKIFSI